MVISESSIFALLMAFMFVTCVLYVVFGQVTVRKLRKKQQTKDALGTEFVSGWDIINVAQALAFPLSWSKKLEQSRISFMYAKASLLREHTNKLDCILAALFYWMMISSGLSGVLLVLLNFLGVFSE